METLDTFNTEVMALLIEKVSFFDDFSEQEKSYVLGYMDVFVQVSPKEVLIEEGTEDDQAMYVLLSGKMSVVAGEEKLVLSQLKVGEIFGEVAFFSGSKRSASVVALSETMVWRIDKDILAKAPVEIREKIQQKILLKLVRLVEDSNNRIYQLSL